MADTPTPTSKPVPELLASSIPQEVHNALMAQATSLANKHFQISGLLIAILAIVICVGGLGAYFAAKWVDRELARAEKSEELYKADKAVSDKSIADLHAQVATNETARAVAEAKVADLQKQLIAISQNQQKQKDDVLKPGKTASDAYADLASRYKLTTPMNIITSTDKTEQELAFKVPDVQHFTATAIDLQAALATIKVKDGIIAEKDGEITSLKSDLGSAKATLAELQATDNQCQDALKKYKTVAKVTKWKRILNGTVKALEIGASIALGVEIGRLIH